MFSSFLGGENLRQKNGVTFPRSEDRGGGNSDNGGQCLTSNSKRSNIHVIGSSEGYGGENGAASIFPEFDEWQKLSASKSSANLRRKNTKKTTFDTSLSNY